MVRGPKLRPAVAASPTMSCAGMPLGVVPVSITWLAEARKSSSVRLLPLWSSALLLIGNARELGIPHQVVAVRRVLPGVDHPEQIVVEPVLAWVVTGAHVAVVDVRE